MTKHCDVGLINECFVSR